MKLPEGLNRNFRGLCGQDPAIVARALYNLDGSLGATWIAVGEDDIVFYHRPSGGEFSRRRIHLNEIIECDVETEADYAAIRFRLATEQYRLRCSHFDLAVADQIARACADGAARNPIEAPARLTVPAAFCAGIHAVLASDGQVDPVETEWLCLKIPDPVAIEQGSAWLRANGLEALFKTLPSVLDEAQRECLIANQLSAIMVDGFLDQSERDLVDRFRAALNIDPDRYEQIFNVILTRNQVALLVSESHAAADAVVDPAPVELFTTGLLAVTYADKMRHEAEKNYLMRLISDAEIMQEAETNLQSMTFDILLQILPGSLSHRQRLCMLANLYSVAMVDGELCVEEQEMIDRFRESLQLSHDESNELLGVLLIKFNLSVLA